MGLTRLSSTVAALFLGATGPVFEPVATFQASRILPAAIVKGPHHTVSAEVKAEGFYHCLLYTSPSPRDRQKSRMPSSA